MIVRKRIYHQSKYQTRVREDGFAMLIICVLGNCRMQHSLIVVNSLPKITKICATSKYLGWSESIVDSCTIFIGLLSLIHFDKLKRNFPLSIVEYLKNTFSSLIVDYWKSYFLSWIVQHQKNINIRFRKKSLIWKWMELYVFERLVSLNLFVG